MRRLYVTLGGLLSAMLLLITVACNKSEEAPPTIVEAPQQQAETPVEAQAAPPTLNKADATARLAVGEKVPAFRLQDQGGQWRSLEELLVVSKVALVFYRSADW